MIKKHTLPTEENIEMSEYFDTHEIHLNFDEECGEYKTYIESLKRAEPLGEVVDYTYYHLSEEIKELKEEVKQLRNEISKIYVDIINK